MNYYPLLLDLRHKKCLVAGAGRVGRRKIEALLACTPKQILVLDPAPPAAELIHPSLRYEQRGFQEEDLDGVSLVFACTPVREANHLIAAACQTRGILCNVADSQQESDFFVPATARSGGILLAVSTGGASPALARALRQDLEQWLDKGYASLALILQRLRPHVLALELGSDSDAEIFRALCAPVVREQLLNALSSSNRTSCLELLRENLPPALHACLAEIMHDID